MSEKHPTTTTDSKEPALMAGFSEQRAGALVESLNIPAEGLAKAEMLASYGTDEWGAMISSVHEVVAPESSPDITEKHMKVSGPNGENSKYLMHPSQRQAYLEQTVAKIQALAYYLNENNYQAYLERVSNAIALAVVEAHSYDDGNGRTARTVAGIIRLDMNDQESASTISQLGANRPSEGIRMISFRKYNESISSEQLVDDLLAPEIPLEEQVKYKKMVSQTIWTPFL